MKTIQFTPHQPAKAYHVYDFDNGYYTAWDTRSDVNTNGIADWLRANGKILTSYPRKGVLGKQLRPTQTVHYTEIYGADVAKSINYKGLNYVVCPKVSMEIYGQPNRMLFISEDAEAIKQKRNNFIDNGDNPLLLYRGSANAAHIKLEVGKPHTFLMCFNPKETNQFEIILPEACEFIGYTMTDHVSLAKSSGGLQWTNIFNHTVQHLGNKIHVEIIPTEHWDAAVEQRAIVNFSTLGDIGRKNIGWFEFKFTEPGDFVFPGIAGATFTVEGDASQQGLSINTATDKELDALKSISGIGPATVKGIVEARNEKPFEDQKDLERAKYVGPVRAEDIMNFPVKL
jgi:hypothetical protein